MARLSVLSPGERGDPRAPLLLLSHLQARARSQEMRDRLAMLQAATEQVRVCGGGQVGRNKGDCYACVCNTTLNCGLSENRPGWMHPHP